MLKLFVISFLKIDWRNIVIFNKDIERIPQELSKMVKVGEEEIEVWYGRLPSKLVEHFGFEGIVFYFQTTNCYNDIKHENAVKPLLRQIEDQIEDYYLDWRQTKIEAVVWEEYNQITLCSWRVRDIG